MVRALCGWVHDLRRIEYSLCQRENFAKLVCAEGLQQIILQPAGNEVAIKTHIIDLPGCNDHGSRFAHFSETIDIVQRIARFRYIYEEDIGAGGHRERLNIISHPAFVYFFRGTPHLSPTPSN